MLRFLPLVAIFFSFSAVCQTSYPQAVNSPLTGRTTGPMAYLNFGLGEDRLGGAKMTYLDSNIIVKVVDSVIGNYRIQLSNNHFAYLPKNNFKADSLPFSKPFYLTNSWRVFGDSLYDYVTVGLDAPLPYQSIQQINPSRLVIDVFGATNNTNWITQLSSAKEITNVYHEQIEDDVFRIFIELKHQQHWGYSIYYEGKRLTVRVKRKPLVTSLPFLKIAVDAGHGGTNMGATGRKTRIMEKEFTLKMALELKKALEKERANVFMTRDHDTTLGMIERWDMLNKAKPDFLVSIHLNSSSKDSIQGVSTYYKHIGFRPMTQFILARMLELGLKDFGNIGSFNFSLNGPTDYPNCLVEVAFLSNPEDEQRILDPQFHKDVAKKIVEGIKDWLISCE
jgi:N-acetylmuramoyl-L-alanine amidase